MRKIGELLAIVSALILFGCDSNQQEKSVPTIIETELPEITNGHTSKGRLKYVDIVLCDLTPSMINREPKTKKILDSIPLQNIKEHAAQVWKEAEFGTKVIYLGLNNRDYNRPICTVEKVGVTVKGGQIAAIKKQYNEVIPKMIQDTIAKNFNPDTYEQTCITHALNNVYGKFKNYHSGEKLRLIILSDMVEDCERSPFGYISFENQEKLNRTQNTMDTTSKGIMHDLNALGVEVYMIYESENMRYDIDMETMKNYWLKVLKHYGYNNDKNIYADNSFPTQLLHH